MNVTNCLLRKTIPHTAANHKTPLIHALRDLTRELRILNQKMSQPTAAPKQRRWVKGALLGMGATISAAFASEYIERSLKEMITFCTMNCKELHSFTNNSFYAQQKKLANPHIFSDKKTNSSQTIDSEQKIE